ncbi:MAG: gamma carbonic anhydrase family protein [bacterium]|nr:gamma carbonic anhydrase family protein [Gammaproteobacteria bacterium]
MIKTYDGKTPEVPDSCFVSETALLMGSVILGERSGIWPGAIVRGDFATIRIGNGTIIEDNVVVHTGHELVIGNNVIVGHGAVIHCKSIGDNSLIANNATLLDDAEIGSFCIVGAGAVVSPGMKVPNRSLVFGIPGKIAGEVKPHQMTRLERGNAAYLSMFEQYRKDGI